MIPDRILAQRQALNESRRERMRREAAEETAARHAASLVAAAQYGFGPAKRIDFENFFIVYQESRAIVRFLNGLAVPIEKVDQKQINTAMMRMQVPAQRWPDGTLRGFKRLLRKGDRWVSPTMETRWPKSGILHADNFGTKEGLRGEGGIHATWTEGIEELRAYPGHLVELSGYGECVVGDVGWRAEYAKIVNVLL